MYGTIISWIFHRCFTFLWIIILDELCLCKTLCPIQWDIRIPIRAKGTVKTTDQASVCSSIGFEAGKTGIKRWTRHFLDAASFTQPLRGDDLNFLIEDLQRHFPLLNRVQDLEVYASFKQIMRAGAVISFSFCIGRLVITLIRLAVSETSVTEVGMAYDK